MASEHLGYDLTHPVYLDVPMMLSFLAHLDGGISVSEEETATSTGVKERAIKARAGLRAKLFTVVDADFGGEGSAQRRDEQSTETKTQRHHTAASLFNLLYSYLREDEQVLDLKDSGQLGDLRSGQLVEVEGEYLGNPIEDILALFGTLFPYVADQTPASPPPPKPTQGKRSGNPATRAAAAQQAAEGSSSTSGPVEDSQDFVKMFSRMSEDMGKAPVHDLLFKTTDGLDAVVTAASEYYSPTVNEYLRAGEFRVVGKVTKVLRGEAVINLTRRTVLGVAGPEIATSIVSSIGQIEDMSLQVAAPIVRAPAIQLLPMAIFI